MHLHYMCLYNTYMLMGCCAWLWALSNNSTLVTYIHHFHNQKSVYSSLKLLDLSPLIICILSLFTIDTMCSYLVGCGTNMYYKLHYNYRKAEERAHHAALVIGGQLGQGFICTGGQKSNSEGGGWGREKSLTRRDQTAYFTTPFFLSHRFPNSKEIKVLWQLCQLFRVVLSRNLTAPPQLHI
jgi:hypothetical protein